MYFQKAPAAASLLDRWRDEAGIDVISRVMELLSQLTDLPVRRAREAEQEYFVGILRGVQHGINVHADYAPFEAVDWSIGNIVGQLSWNILLNEAPGSDTLIYDRRWCCPDDDLAWRKVVTRDSYDPKMLEGHPFKSMQPVPGDLTFFNSRNFHEVKGGDTWVDQQEAPIRFTVSSFVGLMPEQGDEPASLVLWS